MAKLTKKQKALADKRRHARSSTASTRRSSLVKANATAKFDETIEVALNLGVDPRHADQMVRGVVTLPTGTGKDVRVAVFAKGDKAEEATTAGADMVGAEDLMEDHPGRQDRLRPRHRDARHDGRRRPPRQGARPQGPDAEPEARHGHPERRRGGQGAKGGQVEFRVEKAGIIHAGIGKASFSEARPARPISTPSSTRSSRPSRPAPRASIVQKVALSSSMGPGLKIDVAEVAGA